MTVPILNVGPHLIRAMNVGPLTVKRSTPGAKNDFGGFDAALPFDVVLDPVFVEPVAGRELDQLPEADRTTEIIRLYTLERMFVADDGKLPDRVEYGGRTYRTIRVSDLRQQGGGYIALAALEEEAKL